MVASSRAGSRSRDVTDKEEADLDSGARPVCRDMGYCITNPRRQSNNPAPGSGEADKHTGGVVSHGRRRRMERDYLPLVQLQKRLCLARFALRLRLQGLLVLAEHPLKLLVRPILEEVCGDGRRHVHSSRC